MAQKDLDRYHAAMHGMQTGVAVDQSNGSTDGTPKHLRVGINSALVDSAALATLLMAKGLFTIDEYHAALADAAEAERDRYVVHLKEKYGLDVTLA